MASSSLTPYYNATQQLTFALVSTSAEKAVWRVAGRSLAEPFELSILRKIGPTGSKANDHVILKVALTERDANTGFPATGSVAVDISIPRNDIAVATASMETLIKAVSSLLNDSTAAAATTVAADKLLGGNDL